MLHVSPVHFTMYLVQLPNRQQFFIRIHFLIYTYITYKIGTDDNDEKDINVICIVKKKYINSLWMSG